jgi:hypothetical protein
MAIGKRRRERHLEAFVAASDLPTSPGHPFYTALNLTHLGEPLEPPPVSPARGPPTDWGELVQAHDAGQSFRHRPTSCL